MLALLLTFVLPLLQPSLLQQPLGQQSGPAARHLTLAATASASAAAPGSKISLFLDVTPRAGIHVYAPGAKDYLPIAMTLDRRSGITVGDVKYPKPQTMVFENEKVPVYNKPFRLVQEVSLDRSLKAGEAVTITGTLKYQACDDQVCFIPVSMPVSWMFTIN